MLPVIMYILFMFLFYIYCFWWPLSLGKFIPVQLSISISIIYLPSGTRGVVAQSPEPEAHDKSD